MGKSPTENPGQSFFSDLGNSYFFVFYPFPACGIKATPGVGGMKCSLASDLTLGCGNYLKFRFMLRCSTVGWLNGKAAEEGAKASVVIKLPTAMVHSAYLFPWPMKSPTEYL